MTTFEIIMTDNLKPTSISKFKARIADLHGRFKSRGGVSRENVKVFHYGEGKNHGTYSRTVIEKIANHMAAKLGAGYKLEINAKFGPSWASGKLTDTDHHISMWDPTNEYAPKSSAVLLYEKYKDHIHRFNIVAVNYGGGMGGKHGKHNDCLYDCLAKGAGGKEYLPWAKPSRMKTFLCLDRDALVPLSMMDKLEDKMNVAINIYSNIPSHCRMSTKQNVSRTYNITLANERYTLNKRDIPVWKKLVTGVSLKERTIIFPCEYTSEGEKFYDGKQYFTLSYAEIKEIKRYPMTAQYVIVRGKYESIEEEYKKYIDAVEAIKIATNGKINFYKTGTVKATALNLFEELNVVTVKPDPIGPIEARFINGCPNYGMMFHEEYEGEGYEYDEISFYGSLLRSQIQFPHKEGEFKRITQEEFDKYEHIPFGYYHCEIIGSHKCCMKSSDNYYTSTQVNYAMKKLGLQVKMIEDGDINLIFYPPEKRIQSSVLWRKYVDLLFPLKKEGLLLAKELINFSWGALCEGFKNREFILNLDKEDDIKKMTDDEVITGLEAMKDRDGEVYMWKVTTGKPSQIFKTDYARMKGFITAQGQKCIADIMLPHLDNIVRVHTDGFISKKKLDIELGDNIGDVKFEGYHQKCKVISLNNIEVDCDHCNEMIIKNKLKNHKKTCKQGIKI